MQSRTRFWALVSVAILTTSCASDAAPRTDAPASTTEVTVVPSTTAPPPPASAPAEPDRLPTLVVTTPARNAMIPGTHVLFEGTTDPGCAVRVIGRGDAEVDVAGHWSIDLSLQPGTNVIVVLAEDPRGTRTVVDHSVTVLAAPGDAPGVWQRWSDTDFVRPGGIRIATDGGVWAVTEGGLVRWDPRTGVYEELLDPAWDEAALRSVALSDDGVVWIGFYSTVVQWDGRTSIVHRFESAEDWAAPIEVTVAPDGTVWAAAGHLGVRFFDGEVWAALPPLPGRGEVEAIAVDAHGTVWVGTFWEGLLSHADGVWIREHAWPAPVVVAAENGDVWFSVRDMQDLADQKAVVWRVDAATGEHTEIPMGSRSVWAIAPDGEGAYVGTSPLWTEGDPPDPSGLWYIDSTGGAVPVPGAWDDSRSQVLGVDVAGDGVVWLGGQRGVWRHGAGGDRQYLTDTFGSFSVGFVEFGPQGDVWAGDCLRSAVWRDGRWDRLPEAPEDLWSCDAAIDGDGVPWLAGSPGPMRLAGEQWVVDETDASGTRWQDLYPPLADEGDDRAPWTLAVDSDGGLWAGMIDAVDGVWRRDDGVWHRKELPGEAAVVVGLAADPSGGLYVATRSGVVVWQDDEGAFVSLPAAVAWHPPFQLAAGGGVVWAITWEELLRFDGEAWQRFPVPSGAGFGLVWVDPGGAAWLPAESGAIRFDGEVTRAVSVPYPGERSMQRIAVAGDGAWWIVGSMGLYRWAPEEPWAR